MKENETAPKAPGKATFEAPLPVAAQNAEQAGYPIVVGNCPRCGQKQAATDVGRVQCLCGNWLDFQVAAA